MLGWTDVCEMSGVLEMNIFRVFLLEVSSNSISHFIPAAMFGFRHWYNPFSYLKAYLHRRHREHARRENANRAQGWQGLQRYRDDDGEEEEDQTEYAKVSQVLECSELTLTYYADVP
ncbi:hypothetical protein BC936DRAFT_141872, partial [Jimgerdemannia flammicorona]